MDLKHILQQFSDHSLLIASKYISIITIIIMIIILEYYYILLYILEYAAANIYAIYMHLFK